MSRVRTGSRLHFGLFRLPAAGDEGARVFGGIGLMIDKPGVEVVVQPASEWSAHGPLAERALNIARTYQANSPELEQRPLRIEVVRSALEHVGLGTGTQLTLAVATAVGATFGHPYWTKREMAQRCGRGLRSGIGISGFLHGGFLVDGGKKSAAGVAPVVAWGPFADEWSIVLILPKDTQGIHGDREREVFAQPGSGSIQQTDALCRLVLMGILPALFENDLAAFGEALFEFNRKAGEMFQPWQGGVYADPATAALVNALRDRGIRGVGQSSWGPAVFAIMHDEQIADIVASLQREHGIEPARVLVTKAMNEGAVTTDV